MTMHSGMSLGNWIVGYPGEVKLCLARLAVAVFLLPGNLIGVPQMTAQERSEFDELRRGFARHERQLTAIGVKQDRVLTDVAAIAVDLAEQKATGNSTSFTSSLSTALIALFGLIKGVSWAWPKVRP